MSFNHIRFTIKINIILILFPSPPRYFGSFFCSCCLLLVRALDRLDPNVVALAIVIKKGRQVSTNHISISCYNHHGGRASLAHHSIVRWGDSHIGIYTRFLLGYHPRSAIYITWLGRRVISSIVCYLATYAATSLATYL